MDIFSIINSTELQKFEREKNVQSSCDFKNVLYLFRAQEKNRLYFSWKDKKEKFIAFFVY